MARSPITHSDPAADPRWAGLACLLLAILVATRWAASAWPTMWLWGLNPQRFTPPPWGFILGAVALLPFVPRLDARIARLLDSIARAWSHPWTRYATASGLAITVWLLTDNTWFTGDFAIRRDVTSLAMESRFEQSLPLELLLFEHLPRHPILAHVPVPRLLGAAAAFVLGMAGIAIGRTLSSGGAAVAIAVVIGMGGFLTSFTGLGKPAALISACTALVALLAMLAVTRHSLGAAALLGVTTAFAVLLHRTGLACLPCWLVATVLAVRNHPVPINRRAVVLIAIALAPLAVLVATGPRLLEILFGFDVQRHVTGASGAVWAWNQPVIRTLDLLNLVATLVPVGVALLPLGLLRSAYSLRDSHSLVALLVAAPWVLAFLAIAPQQGLFRDLDVLAAGGVAFAILSGIAIARMTPCSPPVHRLAVAATLISISATLQLLLCFHDAGSGMDRARAFALEPPARSETERARTWDFLALRAFTRQDWPLAVEAGTEAVRHAPSPRHLLMLAIARTYAGDHVGARDAYASLLARTPDEPLAWVGLHGAALRLGDQPLADSTRTHLSRYARGSPEARQIAGFLRRYPEVLPAQDLEKRPEASP